MSSVTYPTSRWARARSDRRSRLASLVAYPELLALLALTAVLNLWDLSINGWANTYYAAAVKSTSGGLSARPARASAANPSSACSALASAARISGSGSAPPRSPKAVTEQPYWGWGP